MITLDSDSFELALLSLNFIEIAHFFINDWLVNSFIIGDRPDIEHVYN